MTDTGTPRTQAIAEIQEAASAAATPEVIVLPTLGDAARRACQDTVRILSAAVTERGAAHLALTGGSGGGGAAGGPPPPPPPPPLPAIIRPRPALFSFLIQIPI